MKKVEEEVTIHKDIETCMSSDKVQPMDRNYKQLY